MFAQPFLLNHVIVRCPSARSIGKQQHSSWGATETSKVPVIWILSIGSRTLHNQKGFRGFHARLLCRILFVFVDDAEKGRMVWGAQGYGAKPGSSMLSVSGMRARPDDVHWRPVNRFSEHHCSSTSTMMQSTEDLDVIMELVYLVDQVSVPLLPFQVKWRESLQECIKSRCVV